MRRRHTWCRTSAYSVPHPHPAAPCPFPPQHAIAGGTRPARLRRPGRTRPRLCFPINRGGRGNVRTRDREGNVSAFSAAVALRQKLPQDEIGRPASAIPGTKYGSSLKRSPTPVEIHGERKTTFGGAIPGAACQQINSCRYAAFRPNSRRRLSRRRPCRSSGTATSVRSVGGGKGHRPQK